MRIKPVGMQRQSERIVWHMCDRVGRGIWDRIELKLQGFLAQKTIPPYLVQTDSLIVLWVFHIYKYMEGKNSTGTGKVQIELQTFKTQTLFYMLIQNVSQKLPAVSLAAYKISSKEGGQKEEDEGRTRRLSNGIIKLMMLVNKRERAILAQDKNWK